MNEFIARLKEDKKSAASFKTSKKGRRQIRRMNFKKENESKKR